MDMFKIAALSLMIPLGLAAAPADAQPGERPDFSTLDLDGDGALTLEELQAQGAARFADADADGDGALSREELLAQGAARNEARIERMMEAADGDGDGLLTQAELEAMRDGSRRGDMAERMFDRIDADGDGSVSEEEFAAAREAFGDRRRGHGPRGGDRG